MPDNTSGYAGGTLSAVIQAIYQQFDSGALQFRQINLKD